MFPDTVLQAHLDKLEACEEAREWAGSNTPEWVWDNCERADWLLWWCAKSGTSRPQLVLAASACARTVPQNADGIACLDQAEKWAHDPTEINLVELLRLRQICWRAAYAAYAAAVYAVDAAVYAAYAAVYAVDAAAYAAAYVAYAAAPHDKHPEMCKIIRSILTMPKV